MPLTLGRAEQGLGSTLHVAAAHLGQALQHGAIFMWDPTGQHVGQEYIDPGCGRGENYTNWDWCGRVPRDVDCTPSARCCLPTSCCVGTGFESRYFCFDYSKTAFT